MTVDDTPRAVAAGFLRLLTRREKQRLYAAARHSTLMETNNRWNEWVHEVRPGLVLM